jgi:hypothetical protein
MITLRAYLVAVEVHLGVRTVGLWQYLGYTVHGLLCTTSMFPGHHIPFRLLHMLDMACHLKSAWLLARHEVYLQLPDEVFSRSQAVHPGGPLLPTRLGY